MLSPLEIFAKVEDNESLFDPDNWATSLPLMGLGRTKPHHFKEIWNTLKDNADELPFAWRILKDGVCDGCALGTSGLSDWTVPGVHLCSVRLNLLKLNTMGPLDPSVLNSPTDLRNQSSDELRERGRLPYPMIWENGEEGYKRVGWEEALDLVADRTRRTISRDPDRMFTYLTSRGLPNEVYYAFQKTSRFLGTNNVDTSARICHSPSTSGLKKTVGDGATNCSYKDWVGTDLLLLVGTNMANNQPVSMKYIYHAKKAGTKVIVVNPYKEEGLDSYWVPSNLESALFGTKIMDEFYQLKHGGDTAFFNGALKHLVENDRLEKRFLDRHTAGFDEVKEHVQALSWDRLVSDSGLGKEEIVDFADQYAAADSSVSVWSMGITQHSYGQQNVFALSNLALSQGRIGREKCGLNPIRGHSGVQGGAEVGATPTQYGKGLSCDDSQASRQVSKSWGFDVPTGPGLGAMEAIDEMYNGNIDLLYSVGGNFLKTLPQPRYVSQALDRVQVKVFQDLVINPMMLMEPEDVNVIFPAATRYEMPGGCTETTTERRVIYSPEIPGRRIGDARPEWEMPIEIAKRVKSEDGELIEFEDPDGIRQDLSSTIPTYKPIKDLSEKGDQFQWGGPRLYEDYEFNTPDGKAHFETANLHDRTPEEDQFYVTTRRGKQFNSMVWDDHDDATNSERDDVFMSESDARRLNLQAGDSILLKSEHGEMQGRVHVTDRMKTGNLQIHWPEGEALIEPGVTDPSCGIPEYDAFCEVVN